MEGKKIVASIQPIARDLGEIEKWESKKQEDLEKTQAGLGFLFLKELQEEEEEEDFPLYS